MDIPVAMGVAMVEEVLEVLHQALAVMVESLEVVVVLLVLAHRLTPLLAAKGQEEKYESGHGRR
jgi:hypothetical protein